MRKLLLLSILLVVASVGSAQVLRSLDNRSLKGKIDSKRTFPIIVEVKSDGKLTYDKKNVNLAELQAALDNEMDYRMPEQRRVYIAAEKDVKFSAIRDVLLIGRKIGVDDFNFAAYEGFGVGASPESKIILEEPEPSPPKPGPLVLQVNVDKLGKILLNVKTVTEDELTASLKTAFETRKKKRIYRPGSREVEKTVYLRLNPSTQFQVILRVLESIKSSGAYPIVIEIDWLDT